MRVLVTGGAGFVGSHVVDAYLAQGHSVTVLDNLSTGKKKNLSAAARFVWGDIRQKNLSQLFRRGRFEVLNHHAAHIDVRRSVTDPLLDADINLRGFLNLLEAARGHGVKKVILAASGGTYYGECPRPAREEDPPRPLSPYGVAKVASEHYLWAYRALHGLSFTVLRYSNVYGPRQDPHGEAGVVAIFCQRLLAGVAPWVYGDGKQSRDYVHVKDVARANLAALNRGPDQSFNIGTGRSTDVHGLLKRLSASHGGALSFVRKPARPGELFRSVLNVSKASRVLGWKPAVSLEEGLAETYRYIAREA